MICRYNFKLNQFNEYSSLKYSEFFVQLSNREGSIKKIGRLFQAAHFIHERIYLLFLIAGVLQERRAVGVRGAVDLILGNRAKGVGVFDVVFRLCVVKFHALYEFVRAH